ncbi:MAG: CHASE domain-containing protein, partial [bacterium]
MLRKWIRRWPWFLPCLVLTASLAVTLLAWNTTQKAASYERQAEFDFLARETSAHIAQRLKAYEQILRGIEGLFAASVQVTRGEFRTYVESLRVEENYPGIQALEFAQVVPAAARAAHLEAIRRDGFPGYAIRPEGRRETYTSIVYVEPFSALNQRAFGYDMFTEPVRRQAMEQARDTGRATLSSRVTLVQEDPAGRVQAGFLMFIPVYQNRPGLLAPDTQDERRARLSGWVLAPFRMENLMAGIL